MVSGEVLQKQKKVHEEVCKYITQFDDGNDNDVMEVCGKSSKKLAIVEKHQKLESYLDGLIGEYNECEQNTECKQKMSPEMQANSKQLHKFIGKLNEIDKMS